MEYTHVNNALNAADAERGLLGILIRYPDQLELASGLKKSDFTGADRQGIYAALTEMRARGDEPAMAALSAEVKKLTGRDVDIEIIECTSQGLSSHMLRQYLRMVREAADRRRLNAISHRLEERSTDPGADIPQLITKAIDALKELFNAPETLPHTPAVMTEAYMMLEDIYSGTQKAAPTGVTALDNCIRGFYPAELTIVGARTGSGKSAFAINAALAAAASGLKVLFVSTEMNKQQLGMRLLANLSGVPMSAMRSMEKFDQEQWDDLAALLVDEENDPISWLTGERDINDIFSTARALKSEGKCDLLIVDYLQQLHFPGAIREEWLRLGRISMKLKELAVDLQIPVVATAQLNRMNEGESSPGLDSLRGSGSLEQDADNVILMSTIDENSASPSSNMQCYIKQCREKKLRLVIFTIAKQRQGETGRLAAGFNGEHMRFEKLG